MTSPNTTPELPYITSGIIWDGVTEYNRETPPGFPAGRMLRLFRDGTRQFTENWGLYTPVMFSLNSRRDAGWENIGITFQSISGFRDGGFFDYDGTLTKNPVNQHYLIKLFREHAARFAHELDAAMGHHTLYSAEESDRLIVHRTLAAMIGNAAVRYEEWEAVNPEELIVGGVYDGTLLWKRNEEEYIGIDTALCGQCDIATFARRFLFNADLPAFRRAWRQGIIYSADRSTTPWSPLLFDVVPAPFEDFYDKLDLYYHKMLEHYDHVVGPAEHQHDV